MADHTLKRSLTTKPVTIQPPLLHAMNVGRAVALLRTKAGISIKQAGGTFWFARIGGERDKAGVGDLRGVQIATLGPFVIRVPERR